MSRTYRNTKKKQGVPKWSQRNFNQFQLDMIDIPAPKRPPNKYVFVAEVITVPSNRKPPKDLKDPRWVTKGTPHAIAERVPDGDNWWTRETGRYYLPEPEHQVEKKRWKHKYDRTYDNRDDWREAWRREWDHREVFEHVHKNQTGGSRRAGEWAQYEKRKKRCELRREGVNHCRNWEDEYHFNEHLLPYIYILDNTNDDYWDWGDEFNWLDDYDSEYDEPNYSEHYDVDDFYYDWEE